MSQLYAYIYPLFFWISFSFRSPQSIERCGLSLDAILFSQFVCEITEGGAGEEIRSSVNYLFFNSTSLIYGKNQQVRQSTV